MEPEHALEVCEKAGKLAYDAIELAGRHYSQWHAAISKMSKALSKLEDVVASSQVSDKSLLAFKYYQVEKYHMEMYRYLKQERLFLAYRAADDGLRLLKDISGPMKLLYADSFAARRIKKILPKNFKRRRTEAFYYLEYKRMSQYTDLINKRDMAEYSYGIALKNEQYDRAVMLKKRVKKLNQELKKLDKKND